jgi:hypothetical protein
MPEQFGEKVGDLLLGKQFFSKSHVHLGRS